MGAKEKLAAAFGTTSHMIDAVQYPVEGNQISITERARPVVDRLIREALREVYPMIRDMTDPEDCWFDHHGGCQAHGYLSLQPGEKCPHAEAKEWLAANANELEESCD